MSEKGSFSRLLHSIENHFDFLKYAIKKKRGNFDPAIIVPYLGFGSDKVFYIRGRVLENKGISGATAGDNIWKNMGNMFKRFESDEVPKAEISLEFNQQQHSLLTDEEGYFELNFNPGMISPDQVWHKGEIEIIRAPVPFTPGIKSICRIMVPSSQAAYGIISDIDDTIVETNATSLIKMATLTFLNNAKTRSPLRGVSALYKAFEKGNTITANPFFYVSSSPWNIYDLLLEFLENHNIPMGPLLLKDYGIDNRTLLSQGHLAHKYFQIQRILNTYPTLPFILVGDNGQEDPVIYRQIVKDFPGRILSIYIRDVNVPKHTGRALQICEEVNREKIVMLLAKDSAAIAQHAVEAGYITQKDIHFIEQETKKDSVKQ